MEEKCAVGIKCEGKCRIAHKELESCPAFYTARDKKNKKERRTVVRRHNRPEAREDMESEK
jgi:hypothetical protein